jgi:putative transposase
MKILSYEEYQEKVKNLKSFSDVSNFAKELVAPTIQAMLEGEISNHLGYDKYTRKPEGKENSRNGYSQKKIQGDFGVSTIKVPRDRNCSFDPVVIKKYENVESGLEEKVISMYAKGMSTRDINQHMSDIYGASISSDMVSKITDQVLPLVQEWQCRPLERVYTVVYLDGVHFKVRESGKIENKCAYIMLGITQDGLKDVLGIWIGENEGAKFWLQTLNEIKHRGVEHILIACIDGLSGFSDAIKTIYPESEIQRCIVHQIRNTTKYIPYKEKKEFCKGLREIYTASTEEEGYEALQKMKLKWPKYTVYLESWDKNWSELSTFFVYPELIRKMIYTTNPIESLNRQFRKVTKTTCIFPNDISLKKLLWLAQKDIIRKWTMPIAKWGEIIAQFAIFFPKQIKL